MTVCLILLLAASTSVDLVDEVYTFRRRVEIREINLQQPALVAAAFDVANGAGRCGLRLMTRADLEHFATTRRTACSR